MGGSSAVRLFHSRLNLPVASCSTDHTVRACSHTNVLPIASVVAARPARPAALDATEPTSSLMLHGFHCHGVAMRGRSGERQAMASCYRAAIGNATESPLRYAPVPERQALTLYEILGVSSDASETDLKVAFRCMAKKFHPDRAPPEAASEYNQKFLELRRAYNVLKDHRTRALYDFEIKNSPKYWAQKYHSQHRQWRGRNWETDQCWTS